MAQIPVIPGFGQVRIRAPVAAVAPIFPQPIIETQVTAESFSIMCFSWNAAGLKLCETMSQIRADETRSGLRGFITKRHPCVSPNFFEEIRSSINLHHPSLVVMTTQDEDSSGTYFHSELLPNTLPEIDYFLLKRDVFDGIGETASGVKLSGVPTGQPRGSALRISIYARGDVIHDLHIEDQVVSHATSNQGNKTAGAIASHVWHPVYGKFTFIAVHIPAGITPLQVGKTINFPSYRTSTKATNILSLLELYNKLIGVLPTESQPDHIFLLGDMNYDIVMPGKTPQAILNEISSNITMARIKELQRFDEIRWAMSDYPLIGFKEGVAGEGPLFAPTWSLSRGRGDNCSVSKMSAKIDPSCFSEPDTDLSSIGWHDRILYKEAMTSNYIAHCIDYNRIDIKNMHQSTHSGVTALFELRQIY